MVLYKGFYDATKNHSDDKLKDDLYYLTNKNSIYDMFRFIHATVSVFVFFALHLNIDKVNVSFATNLAYFGMAIWLRYTSQTNVRIVIRTSCVIILWIYMLSPIIMTLTQEVSTDTIYLYYFGFNLIYCIDLTKTSILNEINTKQQAKIDRKQPLTIDDTYINYKTHNICTLGYNFNIIASTLLCSRYTKNNDASFLLLCNLIMFMIAPYYKEKAKVHENTFFTMTYVILGMIITYLCDKILFCSYCIFICVVLVVSLFLVFAINQYITNLNLKIRTGTQNKRS